MPSRVAKLKPERPRGGWRRTLELAMRQVYRTLVERFGTNDLLTYASAIAFQVLIAAVALVLLGLALLDVLGLQSVWETSVRPFFESRFTFRTFSAVDSTVLRIFATSSVPLLVFAALLAVWEVSGAVRAVMGALNNIYECDESRSLWRRFGRSLLLAVVIIVCVGGALFSATLMPRVPGPPNALGLVFGWVLAVALLSTAVWTILRLAPVETRSAGWTSVGSILIVVAWIVASIGFRYYVENVADYKTALGNLAAFLTLTAYLYTSSIIFLTGAQVDELLRHQSQQGRAGLDALTHLGSTNGTGAGRRSRTSSRST